MSRGPWAQPHGMKLFRILCLKHLQRLQMHGEHPVKQDDVEHGMCPALADDLSAGLLSAESHRGT